MRIKRQRHRDELNEITQQVYKNISESCEKCRLAQKQSNTHHHSQTATNSTDLIDTQLNRRSRNLSSTYSDSDDSAIDTASLSSDPVSLASDLSSFSSDISSCDTETGRLTASVSIHDEIAIDLLDDLSPQSVKIKNHQSELDKLAEHVTGVPFVRYTRQDVCEQCATYYDNAEHSRQHQLMRMNGIQDYFTIDLTGMNMEIHIEHSGDNYTHNSFYVSPQATYYMDLTSETKFLSLPREAMIPPSDRQAFEVSSPPSRPWITMGHPERREPTALFTVMCYNVLCDKYCTRQQYGYSPSWALNWEYRKKAILEEIRHYDACIVALQEVETEQFYQFFLPEMEKVGYKGVFGAKSRARTMQESEAKFVDGCAIFWKSTKFDHLADHLIEFNQLAIANADGSENILNRVMTKDNVGLCVLLETKEESWENGTPEIVNQPILISTVHMVWDPEYCDVKLIQSLMLTSELKNVIEQKAAQSLRPGTGKIDCSNMPMLLCGDLNSLPDSGVVELLSDGKVSIAHPDFKDIDYEQVLNTFSHTKDNDYLTHAFSLKNAYDESIMPHTNYTYDFKGIIDYVFFTDNHMNPLGVLGPYDSNWFTDNKVVGCPHPHIPSDHFSLLAEFELHPTQRSTNSGHRR